MVHAPNLVAAGAARSSGDKELPRTMSPIEATYVMLSLIHQKLYNPKLQENDNGASWIPKVTLFVNYKRQPMDPSETQIARGQGRGFFCWAQ
jgi:hypothetical protein